MQALRRPSAPSSTRSDASRRSCSANAGLHRLRTRGFSASKKGELRWPARRDGTPRRGSIRTRRLAPRVWESFPTPAEVFGLDGKDDRNSIPRECARLAGGKRLHVFRLAAKNDRVPVETSDFLQATGQPLIDRNLNFAVFDVRLNQEEADYIRSNKLDTVDGQRRFAAQGLTVSFSLGSYDGPTTRSGGRLGTIEIKTAWRILERRRGDRTQRYFVRQGLIFVAAGNSASGRAFCVRARLGLVGFHIVHRTENPARFSQDWVWSTFEHVDNAPLAANPGDRRARTPSRRRARRPPARAGASRSSTLPAWGASPTPRPRWARGRTEFLWARSPPYAARYAVAGRFGTQVVRCWSVFPETEAVTSAFQQALRGTPWANYRLVGSQWQGGVEDPVVENGNIPRFLSNPSLETYIQGNASCLVCHGAAQTAAGQDANFSFLLRLAALRPAP